jgi:outer membrane protein OmpA-like peptidoglycan-associated protein
VNFETGKADLDPESYPVLDELVAYLKRKDDEKIEVGGHTDNVGTAANNLKLSEDRANTVRAYLLMKGIDPERVTAKGYGLTEPVADNKSDEGRAQNRRTEVKIL